MSDNFTAHQQRAFESMDAWVDSTSPTESSFYCLQGYAGVGKTWLVAAFLRALLARRPGIKIIVSAPTNKAVDVLRRKCGGLDVGFRTLDSFLGYRVKRNDDWEMERSQSNKRDGASPDLLVVDEASMVKADYHNELRRRRIPVLYVGDPAQLQPVGEESSPAFSVPDRVLMTEVVRQEAGNPIIGLATYLRELIERDSTDFVLQDIRAFTVDGDRRISFTPRSNVYAWACAALDKGMDCRVLAFTNAAVNEHNARMHALRYPEAPLFGEGELALVNEAFDYDDDTLLTNGELLRVVKCERVEPIAGVETYEVAALRLADSLEVDGETTGQKLTLKVAADPDHAYRVHRALTSSIYETIAEIRDAERKGGRVAELRQRLDQMYATRKPLNKLAPLRHSYSCTVHKSQGSTYDVAMVDFGDVYRSREMRARLMYVAATRPSKFLVMVHNG